jgi:hypothetical protein
MSSSSSADQRVLRPPFTRLPRGFQGESWPDAPTPWHPERQEGRGDRGAGARAWIEREIHLDLTNATLTRRTKRLCQRREHALSTTFKAFFIDKAWVFLKNPSIQRYVVEALKTWRKANAAMILPTQSLDELRRSDVLDVIIERGRPSRSRWDVR